MEANNYTNENQQLKRLHLQRMGRLLDKRQQISMEQVIVQQKHLIKLDESKTQTKVNTNQIYLNSLIYDKRQVQQKYNNVTLANFLHLNIKETPIRPVSTQVEAIMITNYGFQMQVFEPIVKSKVPLLVFNRQGNGKQGSIIRKYEGFQNMTVLSPPKNTPGYGVFHTKLWLIKFKTFLRIVVCTSNNHLYDWAIWQNAYWYHDCPLKSQNQNTKQKKQSGKGMFLQNFDYESDFVSTLSWIIKQMQPVGFDILKQMKIQIKEYSFQGITAILIPSLAGRFRGQQMERIGLGKIRKIMKLLKNKMKSPTLTVNCTSLGKIDAKFVSELYTSFAPSSGLFSPNLVKLVYPTKKYINEQTCGAAEVLFLTPQNYSKCDLKKQIFHRYQPSAYNGANGSIPHLKTIVLQQKSNSEIILYMGSHNLTKAAWGTFQKNETQISCSNEQLGLLFLNYNEQQLLQWLPYRYPPEKYNEDDVPFLKENM